MLCNPSPVDFVFLSEGTTKASPIQEEDWLFGLMSLSFQITVFKAKFQILYSKYMNIIVTEKVENKTKLSLPAKNHGDMSLTTYMIPSTTMEFRPELRQIKVYKFIEV